MQKEISKFGMFAKDFGVSTTTFDSFKNSMTPYIIEERQMNIAQMDVFSRLMMDRIIWIGSQIDSRMSPIIQAQLMFLDSLDTNDITIHVDTPGGEVKAGLSIVDVMDYIKSDVCTVNVGMAASMGSVILGAGTKGKRSSLRFSKTMLHHSSGGVQGVFQDAKVNWEEWNKTENTLFGLLGSYCGKDAEVIKTDCERDFWLTAEEAVNYGIIDEVIYKKR